MNNRELAGFLLEAINHLSIMEFPCREIGNEDYRYFKSFLDFKKNPRLEPIFHGFKYGSLAWEDALEMLINPAITQVKE